VKASGQKLAFKEPTKPPLILADVAKQTMNIADSRIIKIWRNIGAVPI
jgi:hypothetical protein